MCYRVLGQQTLALLNALAQYAVTREVRQQELHLVSQDSAPLQVDVLGMRRGEWNRQQLQ
jgi:hypothetical protein